MRSFRFLPQARRELFDEIAYYESLREGLGLQFEQALTRVIRSALSHPEHGAPRSKNTRRMLIKGFPFAVIYRVSDAEVLIVAIADARRRPDYWARRVR